jgi:hypothetical protein
MNSARRATGQREQADGEEDASGNGSGRRQRSAGLQDGGTGGKTKDGAAHAVSGSG